MATKNKFKFGLMFKKGLEIFIYGGIGALVSYLSGLPQTETVIAAIAVLKMVQNYIKNKDLGKKK